MKVATSLANFAGLYLERQQYDLAEPMFERALAIDPESAEAFAALPDDLKAVVEIAAQAVNTDMLSEFTFHNAQALKTLEEEHGVKLRSFPPEVMARLREITWEHFDELAAGDAFFAKVLDSYRSYFEAVMPYSRIAEQQLMNLRPAG